MNLVILALVVACIATTVTKEEVFKEVRDWCVHKSKTCESLMHRKFFYLFTCEYCFSHWVTLGLLIVTRYKLLYSDTRGYLVAFFAIVYIANFWIALFSQARIRVHILREESKNYERRHVRNTQKRPEFVFVADELPAQTQMSELQ